MEAGTSARQVAARLIDMLTLSGVLGLAWLAADPSKLGRALEPGLTAGVLLWIPLLLLMRVLIEERPPAWSTLGARCFESVGIVQGAGMRRTVAPALAGAMGAGLGLLAGWATVHPFTDYPSAARLVLVVAAGSLAPGLAVGIVVGLWSRQSEDRAAVSSRCALFGGSIAVLGGIAWWHPGQGWVFPTAHSVLTGLFVCGVVAITSIVVVLVALSRAAGLRRIGMALAFALLPALLIAWASRPLPGRDQPPGDWPHAVLLITVDTLRADHLGAYGYARDTSPRIDSLAGESVLFERAYAPMPTTDPSHVAILTGLLPRSSGVVKNGLASADPDAPSLASWFLERGYRTGAVSSRAHLDPEALRLPGFQTASMPAHASPAREAHRRASGWIRRHGGRPFFLWVHFWDPHAPYAPPPEDAARFVEGLKPAHFVHGIDPYVPRPRPHTADEIRYATALYDAEIRHADRWVGRLLDETRERFGRENVLVVLTSDHGETLGELDADFRYAFDHGKLLAHHELHVPLLMSWPRHLAEGLRVEQPVPTAGIAPTVACVLGDDFGGADRGFAGLLARNSQGAGVDPRSLLVERRSFDGTVEVPFLAAPELGVIEGRWLYVENPVRGIELHDIRFDPRGERNLAPLQAERVTRLADVLRRLALDHPPPAAATDSMNEEKIERLRSLGYIQ